MLAPLEVPGSRLSSASVTSSFSLSSSLFALHLAVSLSGTDIFLTLLWGCKAAPWFPLGFGTSCPPAVLPGPDVSWPHTVACPQVELDAEQPLAGSHSQSPSALETEPVPPEESSARTGERREVRANASPLPTSEQCSGRGGSLQTPAQTLLSPCLGGVASPHHGLGDALRR